MLGHAAERIAAYVPFADMLVAIDTRIVSGARVVEVNGADVPGSYRAFQFIDQSFQAIFLANVVAGGERVRGVETNAKWDLWTAVHDCTQVFKAMPDALALARGVL